LGPAADYYFVTTQGGKGFTSARDGGGLWRLRRDGVDDPEAGGELTLLLDGFEAIGLNKPDTSPPHVRQHPDPEDPAKGRSMAWVAPFPVRTIRATAATPGTEVRSGVT
jgi:hypothetical protein